MVLQGAEQFEYKLESDNAFHKQQALRTVAGASGVTINLRDMSALSEREERACAAENIY